ncbi:hypothetical protein CA830_11745, partial [Burkholderia multivorans]
AVVVAVGGARGITAELMKALAEHVRPTLYLIGSSDVDAGDATLAALARRRHSTKRRGAVRRDARNGVAECVPRG